MNGYDSVFANANDEELEFDVMFDQEDSLIDTVVGCNESGDPLTGAENCPAATAEERSDDESNPDYEKDIDADDTKDAPKDAEGTVGYEFETSPENKGSVDDNTKPEPEHVEGEDDYQEKDVTDKGVEDTVTGTIDNDKDIMEAYFAEAEDIGYEETDTEEERLTDAPLVTPDDMEDVAKKASAGKSGTDVDEVVDNSDKGVEDTVAGTIDNDKDIMEAYFAEAEDILNGQDTNPEVNAEDRSDDESNPDYDKDIDAKDSKDAPKDAEATVGYDFEENPEFQGKVDDQTTVDPKDVKIDEAEDPLNGQDTNPEVNANVRACDDCDVDYEDIDADDTKGAPKDAEGTVGYEFEENPEFKNRDFSSTIDPKDVKIDEDVDYDLPADGAVKTVPEPDDAATEPVDNCGPNGCAPTQSINAKCEDVDFDFTESAKSDGVDQDVEDIEDPEDDLNDAVLDDVESKGEKPSLDYDISDEDLIDTVLKN